jgi:CheY-like chemotaxis protein
MSNYRRTVLCVDGFEPTRSIIRAMLNNESTYAEAATGAAEAYRLVAHHQYDAFVIAPGKNTPDGLQLCHFLRQRFPDAPIVFFAASAMAISFEAAAKAGVAAYILKPDFQGLIESVQLLLS